MAEERVDLPVNTPGLSKAEEGFKSLRLQVKEAKLELERLDSQGKRNSEAYQNAAKKLDDLQDSTARIGFQSKQLTDKFAALPGPLGAVGKSINGVKESFETFGKGLTVGLGVVGLLVSAFFAMKKALESTAEGTATLNRVSQAFSAILGPILATVEKVAVPIFNGFAFILEKVAAGFSKFAKFLGISESKIKEATLSVDKVQQDANKAEADRQKEAQQKRDEAEKVRIENAKKAAEERKRQKEEEAKEALELEQRQREQRWALMQNLNDKEKQEEERKKVEAFAVDTKKELERQVASATQIQQGLGGIIASNSEKARQDYINQLAAEGNLANESFTKQLERYNTVRALERQGLVDKKASQAELAAFDAETKKGEIDRERSATETKLGIVSGALGTIAQAVGENTVAGKALAIAQATIDTYAGANKALATYPPPWGGIAAGTVILAGLLNVRKILSTKVPAPPGTKGVSGGGGGGGSSVSAPAPAFSNPSITAPQVGATAAQTGTLANIVAGTMNANQSQTQPLRAYVVQSDLRTEGQLDRRIRTAARLGG